MRGSTSLQREIVNWLFGFSFSSMSRTDASQSHASIDHTMTNTGNTNGFEIIIILSSNLNSSAMDQAAE